MASDLTKCRLGIIQFYRDAFIGQTVLLDEMELSAQSSLLEINTCDRALHGFHFLNRLQHWTKFLIVFRLHRDRAIKGDFLHTDIKKILHCAARVFSKAD